MAMTGGTAYLVKSEKTNYGSNSWTTDLYIYVKLISQNVVANTSTIALGMYVYSKYSIAWSDFGTNGTSYIGTATSGSNCFTFTNGQSGSGTKWLVENKQVTVSHNSNGTLTLPIYWHWGVNSPWGQYTGPSGSYNVTLTTIDRAAPTVTFTVSSITGKLHSHGRYLAVQRKRRLVLDAVFNHGRNQCQCDPFFAVPEYNLLHKGSGKAAVQPGLWNFRYNQCKNSGWRSGQQRQYGDGRCGNSEHYP